MRTFSKIVDNKLIKTLSKKYEDISKIVCTVIKLFS